MRRLAEAIGAHAGLDPPAWLLEARVRERADELGLDPTAYVELVGGSGDAAKRERAHLVERLRVGETRFFRHRAQIDALRESGAAVPAERSDPRRCVLGPPAAPPARRPTRWRCCWRRRRRVTTGR